ncbi:MAG: hypothetical protein F7B18_00425 [Desulfurococcales archaeon]|nr:hypothetical protein [Desulfurococcales archaeon]
MKGRISDCIEVRKTRGEDARKALYRHGVLARDLKIRVEGDYLLLPVKNVEKASRILEGLGIYYKPCREVFEEARKTHRAPSIEASYVLVGGIVVINPRRGIEDLSYYKREAEKILDTIKQARSVYLKWGTHGTYRLPRLIHLAGVDDTTTIHKEYGLRFKVDLSKVYFNPRLSYEHRRVAESTSDEDKVLDMFTGAGGFTVHIAALRRARILAVDLNHYAAAYATINLNLNKKNLKGVASVLRADARLLPEIHHSVFTRIIMNNPTMARAFGRVACSMASRKAVVHYYTLTISRLEAEEEAIESLGHCSRAEVLESRKVLDYSPERSVYVVDVRVMI